MIIAIYIREYDEIECRFVYQWFMIIIIDKGNNKIAERRTIFQRESQNS